MMKFKLVESIDDRLVEKINWTDEQIRDIIDMYTSQRLSPRKIAAKYNVSPDPINQLLLHNHIQLRGINDHAKTYPVYLNTISYIGDIRQSLQLSTNIPLEYKPSIKLGDCTVSEIIQISRNLRQTITIKRIPNGSEILAFYMKLLQERNIKHLLHDLLLDNDKYQTQRQAMSNIKRFDLLTVDDAGKIKDSELVDFYSYEDIAKIWLIKLGSKVHEWEEPKTDSGKYLKDLALQYREITAGDKDYKKVVEKYDVKSVAYSLFDTYGNRIDPINYKNRINEIPYETEFNISSLENLAQCFRSYGHNRDLLYGYVDNRSRVVYIGITQNPYQRGYDYAGSAQETRVISKALVEKLITKLIIFKSYLPTTYCESSSKLLRQLEIEFAQRLFKTYSPENKKKSFEELISDGTLNIDQPGKNQSRYVVNNIQDYAANLASNSLLTISEYEKELRLKFGEDTAKSIRQSRYSYYRFYLPRYFAKHKIKSLVELNDLMEKAGISTQHKVYIRQQWENFCSKNNQNNPDDLDDNINGDDYK